MGSGEVKTRVAGCGHEVPSLPGRQRKACEACQPGQSWKCFSGTRTARCGHEVKSHGGPPRKRCDECKNRPRFCAREGCGKTGLAANAKYCSRWCCEVASGQRLAEPLARLVCALDGCGRDFQPVHSRQRCCSERHGQIHWNRVSRADGRQKPPPWDDRRRARWVQRDAAKRTGEAAEEIDRDAIGDRDGWCCGICLKRIDRALPWPDPQSPSLDHVVPLSKGGTHTAANVRITHLRCNVARGNRGGGEQLALIG